MTLKCSFASCYDNAKWIAVIDEDTRSEKYLKTTGTYFYCDKHKHVAAKSSHLVQWDGEWWKDAKQVKITIDEDGEVGKE